MSVIYATADLHGQLPKVPGDAEALLIAGDICPDFVSSAAKREGLDKGGERQADWLDTIFRAWLEPVVSQGVQVVAIWGNHDFVGEHPALVPELPWTLLQDSETLLRLPERALRIYGTPWVPGLPYWAFYSRQEALEARAAQIPYGLDVLMSHGPPYGAGDFIPTSQKQRDKYHNYGGVHVGDKALRRFLDNCFPEQAPTITICGHIHEARGMHETKEHDYGLVRNVAAVDDNYALYLPPFTQLVEFA